MDETKYIQVYPDTRDIKVPYSERTFGVYTEEGVEIKYFRCPRYVSDKQTDLLDCFVFVNYVSSGGRVGRYWCDDVAVDKADEAYVTFTWELTGNLFDKNITTEIYFAVQAKHLNEEGDEENVFSTKKAEGMAYDTVTFGEKEAAQYADIILQIMAKAENLSEIPPEKIKEAVETYLAENPVTMDESDPTVPEWAKQPTKPTYTAEEVGAEPAGTASTAVSQHNVSDVSHNDIRLLITGLTNRLNALANSDDDTLDQMNELVAYIKSNRTLIENITTGKVNVSDIVNNLTTNISDKPLSAAQGVALKALIDALQKSFDEIELPEVPEKLPNPHKLTFKGAVTAEYDGSGAVTVTIPQGGSSGTAAIARIEKGDTDTAVELEPNRLYVFPEMATLDITLAEPADTAIANEYHFIFKSGATATSLSIPNTVSIPSGFTVDVNKVYEISIMESCLCAQSWEVAV